MSAHLNITASFLQKHNFRVLHAGDDYDFGFTAKQGGVAINLTDAIIWLTIKENKDDTDSEAKLQYRSDDATEIEITTPASGDFTIHFKAADTAGLFGLDLFYDIKTKLTSGAIKRLARGQIEFLENITVASSIPTP